MRLIQILFGFFIIFSFFGSDWNGMANQNPGDFPGGRMEMSDALQNPIPIVGT